MSSLAKCIEKHAPKNRRKDVTAEIKANQEAHLADKLTGQEAKIKAVDDVIAELRAEREHIMAQVRKALTEKVEAKREEAEQPAKVEQKKEPQTSPLTSEKAESGEKGGAKSKPKKSEAPPDSPPANIRAELESKLGLSATAALYRSGMVEEISQEEAERIAGKRQDGQQVFRSDNQVVQGISTGTGKVYLVKGGIEAGNAYNVVAHELGVHVGQLLHGTSSWKRIIDSIEARKNEDSETGKKIREAYAKVPKGTNPEHVNEEALAYLCEFHPEVGVARRVIAILKNILVRLGVKPDILTAADFRALADMAVRYNARKAQAGLAGKDMAEGVGDVMRSVRAAAKAFYSKLADVSDNQFQGMKAQSVEPFLLKQGVKKAEIEALGLREWLATMKPTDKVTREQLADFVRTNTVEFEDVVLGPAVLYQNEDLDYKGIKNISNVDFHIIDVPGNTLQLPVSKFPTKQDAINRALEKTKEEEKTHFAQYTEPGADPGSYREMFVTAPKGANKAKQSAALEAYESELRKKYGQRPGTPARSFLDMLTDAEFDKVNALDWATVDSWNDGHSQYDDIKNPIVRIRFNTVTADGKTLMRIEEMQGPSDSNQSKMPQHLRDNLYQIGVKRAIAYAKANGFDGITFATKPGRSAGETQADRYSLEKHLDRVEYRKTGEDQYSFMAFDITGKLVMDNYEKSSAELESLIGKDIARKIVNGDGADKPATVNRSSKKVLSGLDLRVGGEGLKRLYDTDLPRMFEAWGREKVVDGTLHITEKTPGSFPMFSRRQSLPTTPAFRAWHGASKVQVPVYHGSPTFGKGDNFTFDVERTAGNTPSPGRGLGTFLTEDRTEALGYAGAGGEVQLLAVRIENPLEINSWNIPAFKSYDEARAFRKRKELQGYDGIHIVDQDHWVIFDAGQAKSLDKNSGEFSRGNKDIRFSITSRVKGTGYTEPSPEVTAQFTRGTAVELAREPDNIHDANAISVRIDGEHVGYIDKAKAAEIAPRLDAGEKLGAAISRVYGRDDARRFNVRIGTEKELAAIKPKAVTKEAEKEAADFLDEIEKNGINPTTEKQLFDDLADNPPPPITQQVIDQIKALPKAAARNMLGGLTLRQLREIYGKDLAPMRSYYDAARGLSTDSNRIMNKAEGVYSNWAKLDKKTSDDLSLLMSDATFSGTDPSAAFKPMSDIPALRRELQELSQKHIDTNKGNDEKKADKLQNIDNRRKIVRALIQKDAKRRQAHDELVKRWEALPQAAKDTFVEVRDSYSDNLKDLRQALENRIARQMPDKKSQKMAMEAIRLKFEQYLREGPYFPLARFGDYIVVINNGDEREVHSFDRMGERDRFMKIKEREGWKVKAMTAKEYSPQEDGASVTFVADIVNAINKGEMSAADKNQLIDEVNQIFIRSMPDLSHRKHFAHRKKVEGYSRDQLRAFASNMQHAAHHIARINHADKMTKAVNDLSLMAKEAEEGDVSDVTDLRNELVKRNEQILNPKISPVAQALTSLGFVFNIGPSIASALVNMSQTPLVAFPMLGARHGAGAAARVLNRTAAQYFTSPWDKSRGFDMEKSKNLSADEKEMLSTLIEDGTIDISLARSLAQAAGPDSLNLARTKHGHMMVKVMRVVSYPFHVTEIANRQITAIAAYRLGKSNGMAHADALNYAREMVMDSQFDYDAANRARFMEGNVQRVLFLFKQYSQQMTFLLARSFYNAVKGEDPEVQKVARKQLSMILGGHFLAAGMFGLPVVGTIGEILNFAVGAAGDDDEPWDWEVALRQMLADALGKDAGEAITHGAWRLIPGLGALDISSRMSLGDLWLRSDDRETEGIDTWNKYMNLFLGPLASNGSAMVQGLSAMADGKFDRGVEMMVPKAIKDSMKFIRYSREGVTSWNNATLMDDLNAVELAGQALGFTPSRVSEMYEGKSAIKNTEKRLQTRKERLVNSWIRAVDAGDSVKAASIMEEMNVFSYKNPAFRITPQGLRKARQQKARVQQQTKQGVYMPKTRESLRDIGGFANVE